MWGVTVLLAHVLFMQVLRLHRRLHIASEENAERVYKLLFAVEFPFVWLKGLELALFNTFPHTGVNRRLTINRKFTQAPERRYDDTELLLREAWEHGVHSPRGKAAMARLNNIHGHFSIDNESYLYVLALFVVTPIRLINEFEFRSLTSHEIGSVCKSISMLGNAMQINDVPITFSEYENVVESVYASSKLQVDARGKDIAEAVMKMFLHPFPSFTHSLARRIIYALLDAPIRSALDYPKQPRAMFYFAKALLWTRACFIRFFMPPRPLSWAVLRTSPEAGGPPRYQKYRAAGCPFTYPTSYETGKLGQWNHAGVAIPIE